MFVCLETPFNRFWFKHNILYTDYDDHFYVESKDTCIKFFIIHVNPHEKRNFLYSLNFLNYKDVVFFTIHVMLIQIVFNGIKIY